MIGRQKISAWKENRALRCETGSSRFSGPLKIQDSKHACKSSENKAFYESGNKFSERLSLLI